MGRSCASRPRASRPACARSASAAATASRRTCRTSPRPSRRSSPTAGLGAVWSSCSPDFGARSVIDRFAQIEPTVLLAVDGYRYGGRDFDRGAVVEEIHARVGGRLVRLGYLGRERLGGRLPRRGRGSPSSCSSRSTSTTRCGSCTPAARPACPRRSSRATAGSCSSSSSTRTCTSTCTPHDRAFWFTTTGWMMWNFLVGVLLTPASIVLYDGNPATPTLDRLWDLAAEAGDHVLRHERGVHRGVHEGGRASGGADGARDLRALRSVGSTGLAAVAGGLSLGLRRARRRHVAVLDERRHRRLHGVRRRRAAAAGLRGRAAGALAGLRRAGLRPRRPAAGRRRRRARHHPADAVDAAALLERPGRRAAARGVLRRCTRASGATATGSRSRRAGRRSSTAAATRRSTAAACGWGRARSTARCSRWRRSSTRWSSTSTAGWRCSSCCASGGELDDDAARARSRGASARTARRATCPTTSSPSPRSRARCRASCSRCRSSGSCAAPTPERVASRDSLANPAALDWFAAFARERAAGHRG